MSLSHLRFGGDVQNLKFQLTKNEKVVQSGCSADMIFSVDELIVYLSKYMTLKTGDLIFTELQELVQLKLAIY